MTQYKVIIEDRGYTNWCFHNANTFEKLLILYRYLRLLRLDHLNLFFFSKNIPQYLSRRKPLLLANNFYCNPTHFLFDRIYKVFSIIKIDLLIKNPTKQNFKKIFLKLKMKQQNDFYF